MIETTIDDPYIDETPLAEKIKILVLNAIDSIGDFDGKDIEIKEIVVNSEGDVDITIDVFEEE